MFVSDISWQNEARYKKQNVKSKMYDLEFKWLLTRRIDLEEYQWGI